MRTIHVRRQYVEVFAGPGREFRRWVTRVGSGGLRVLMKSGDWYFVQTAGAIGWMHGSAFQ